MDFKYYVIHKPFGMLSQFTREVEEHAVLGDLFNFPKGIYPVGRLDRDSEGLLILTNDKSITHRLLDPKFKHPRTYWVQLDGELTDEAIKNLTNQLEIKINKKIHVCASCQVKRLKNMDSYPARNPPVRFRKNIPTSWASITLTEGKNRQVRRMFAKVGFPVLRLIRTKIVDLKIENMKSGDVVEWERKKIMKLLNL